MTVAICFKCGTIKHGAFTHCDQCGLRPETEIEIAYSLAYSDHHFSVDALKAVSRDMLQGAPLPPLPKEREQQFVAAAKEYLPIYRNLLGSFSRGSTQARPATGNECGAVRPDGTHTRFVFDYAELAADMRQPAPYPTPDHLRSFAASFDASNKDAFEQANERTTILVNLVFQTPDGREGVIENADWHTVKGAWALTLIAPTGTVTSHLRFTKPSAEWMQAITIHEIVHIYRARGLFDQSEWKRLIGVAHRLGIMQLSIRDFLRATGEAAANGIPGSATLEHFYADAYEGRELFQELMDQEAVAHLVEFARRGVFSTNEVPSIQDILDGIFTSQIAKRSVLSGRHSLIGVLARVEPLKARHSSR